MSSTRRFLPWACLALAALGAVALLAWSAWGRSGADAGVALPLGDVPVTAVANVSPRAHLVGDPVVATLDVTVNRDLASPGGVVVQAVFRPYSRVGPIEVERRAAGRATLLRYVFRLRCVDRRCIARASGGPVVLPKALVRYGSPLGQALLSVDWPAVRPLSRITTADVADPQLRIGSLVPPPASYVVSPRLLGWLLASLAAVVVLSVGILLARRLRTAPAERPVEAGPAVPDLPPLERALQQVEGVSARGEEERRAALESLARALEGNGLSAYAPRARRLAWSRLPPAAGEIAALAGDVRRSLGEGA